MKRINNFILITFYILLIINPKNFSQTDTADFKSSNLPIVVINTHGQAILDSPRIIADMGIINNPDSQRNYITDPFTDYNGRIHIETRGSSTQMFPKKSYGFETQDSIGNNLNVSLMSLPKENDWVLYAPYSDKTLLRNELPYHLARSIGRYASRTAYCELVLNGKYWGMYVLLEKIKQDKYRVDIAKLNPEDTTGDGLTGGYIIKNDKPNSFDWSVNIAPLYGFNPSSFQLQDPNDDKIVPKQKAYIQNFIFEVESTLVSSNYADTINGYAKYLDVPSFVDFFLINELARNPDAFRFSNYMYKKKDSNGGKLFAGPLWDFDLSFANYGGIWEMPWLPDGWNAEIATWRRTFWMKRLISDTNFVNKLKVRWNEIRQRSFSNDSIIAFLDKTIDWIKEARIRNFTKWPIIGDSVWPNYYIGATYEDDVSFFKNWIIDRLNWMDIELTGSPVSVKDKINQVIKCYELSQNYPNPFNPSTTINYQLSVFSDIKITVYNLLGQKVKTLVNAFQSSGKHSIIWDGKDSNNNFVSSGIYFYRIETAKGSIQKKMILLR